jgi:hypothetical protein
VSRRRDAADHVQPDNNDTDVSHATEHPRDNIGLEFMFVVSSNPHASPWAASHGKSPGFEPPIRADILAREPRPPNTSPPRTEAERSRILYRDALTKKIKENIYRDPSLHAVLRYSQKLPLFLLRPRQMPPSFWDTEPDPDPEINKLTRAFEKPRPVGTLPNGIQYHASKTLGGFSIHVGMPARLMPGLDKLVYRD